MTEEKERVKRKEISNQREKNGKNTKKGRSERQIHEDKKKKRFKGVYNPCGVCCRF